MGQISSIMQHKPARSQQVRRRFYEDQLVRSTATSIPSTPYSALQIKQILQLSSTGDSRESQLLSLPAELRNMIYNYALIEDDDIEIHTSTPPPPQLVLLQVNRQMRNEAIKIYYTQNEFNWVIHACDASNYIKWSNSSRFRQMSNISLSFCGHRNWANLLRWIQAAYHGESPGPRCSTEDESDEVVESDVMALQQAFDMMRILKSHQMSWDQVVQCFEHMHKALKATDPGWE